MPIFDSICTAFGTAGTGGYGIKCSSIGGYSPTIQWIVTIFMILYGVNFNFYFFLLLGKNKKEAFKIEEVRWYIGIILVSIGIIVWNIHGMYSSLSHAVRDASFTVGSVITTTGFATADFGTWPVLSQTLLVIIMFCGACAGSTGGGIKVSRIMIILRAVKYEIDSFVHPRSVKVMRMDGKPVEKDTIRAAIMFMSVYVMVFTISVFVVAFDGFDLVTNFTSVTATFNNIGPGLSLVGPTGNYASFSILSKIVFIFDMLAGRLELFPILILCSPALWKKR
jgi:trk system potassium uptake protein TrkH